MHFALSKEQAVKPKKRSVSEYLMGLVTQKSIPGQSQKLLEIRINYDTQGDCTVSAVARPVKTGEELLRLAHLFPSG